MEDELEGYTVDNSCVHKYVFCECSGVCSRYCNTNSKEGKRILEDYEFDVRCAVKKISEKYKDKYFGDTTQEDKSKEHKKIRDDFLYDKHILTKPNKTYKIMVKLPDSSDDNGGKF